MANAQFNINLPNNEPITPYGPGSPEKAALKKRMEELKNQVIEIPLIIGGKEIKTGNMADCVVPHDHKIVIGKYTFSHLVLYRNPILLWRMYLCYLKVSIWNSILIRVKQN